MLGKIVVMPKTLISILFALRRTSVCRPKSKFEIGSQFALPEGDLPFSDARAELLAELVVLHSLVSRRTKRCNWSRRFKHRISCDISHGFSTICDISHGRCDISHEDGPMRYIASKRGPILKQTRTLFTLVQRKYLCVLCWKTSVNVFTFIKNSEILVLNYKTWHAIYRMVHAIYRIWPCDISHLAVSMRYIAWPMRCDAMSHAIFETSELESTPRSNRDTTAFSYQHSKCELKCQPPRSVNFGEGRDPPGATHTP